VNVTLIGDSIRMAYEPLVVEKLSGRAEVWGPVECCGTSRYVLEHLEDWVLSRPADVVHMNEHGNLLLAEAVAAAIMASSP